MRHERPADERALAEAVGRHLRPLQGTGDLDPLVDRVGDARVVMLGEASHGTSEYYTWRARITQRLIREKGFSFIAVEGDWPDAFRVNRFVRGYEGVPGTAYDVLNAYERWPTWMWANWETVALVAWLERHNRALPEARRAGFYGLDVYSLWESLDEVVGYLEGADPDALAHAREAFACFEPYGRDEQAYARATALTPESCEDEVVDLLGEIRQNVGRAADDAEAGLDAIQNARAVAGAERYYRTMVRGGSESWNVRDRHMMGTLDDLLDHHGPDSKAVVWEHNSHIGDARATDMADAGMVNVGQLARERYGEDAVVLVGFGSHRGEVIAADAWGAPPERMTVPPAREGSWEDVLSAASEGDALLLTHELPDEAAERRGHRAIGVVYDPRRERYGNYVPSNLRSRYDAFLFLEVTGALHPLHVQPDGEEPPVTYPWGV